MSQSPNMPKGEKWRRAHMGTKLVSGYPTHIITLLYSVPEIKGGFFSEVGIHKCVTLRGM